MSGLLEVNGINVTFDGFKAINNLSLSISNNELRAIIGLSLIHISEPTRPY